MASADDLAGKSLGPFQVVELIGAGGMARVYKAVQPSVGRHIALKVLPRHFADDATFVARFEREARVIASLEHPHILPVYDFGQADGYMYLAMRLVSGGSLQDRLSDRPAPLSFLRHVVAQVVDALDYAHAHGVIHRDLKPSNILLDARGNCLLADFGIAKSRVAAAELTTPGEIVGTATYMSPEQGMGRAVDARSDVYSLGVILFQMATGVVPFAGSTPLATVIHHVQSPLTAPRDLNPALPEALARVITGALAKDPAARYQTAAELGAAVVAALPGVIDEIPTEPHEAPTVAEPPAPTPGGLTPGPFAPPVYAAQPDPPTEPAIAPEAAADTPRGRSPAEWALVAVGVLSLVLCLAALAGGGYLISRLAGAIGPPGASATPPAATPGAGTPGAGTPELTPGTPVAAATTPAAEPSATPTAGPTPLAVATRPPAQGLFFAPRAGAITLDGEFDDWAADWAADWSVIGHNVYGAEHWAGPGDASGLFQAAWSADGLYLAVQASDDRFVAAPAGELMFRGDSLELLFDRDLAGDYTVELADGDDYQIGVAARADFSALDGYRWAPAAGELAIQGAALRMPGGYRLELLIPWAALDMPAEALPPAGGLTGGERSFGFALSLNDNDDTSPAQQSMVSSAPGRSTYNQPGQWGTLVLRP